MYDAGEISDRVELEALRGEFVDAVMVRDFDRLASLFTDDGAVRMPEAGAEAVGRAQIRAAAEHLQGMWDCFVQTTHPGLLVLDGDTASGRAYISELMYGPQGESNVNHGIYHDRYRRTAEGWRFVERRYEVRYVDSTPVTGAAPTAQAPAPAPAGRAA